METTDDNTSILNIFRIVAPAFKAIEDDTVSQWIQLTKPFVNRKLFGKLYEQALALLTAHRMQLANCGEEAESSESGGGLQLSASDTLRVSSYSEGETSISFSNSVAATETNADLSLTSYGVQYLALQRMVVIPIRCSGEVRI